jgi:predicted TIM-barrel fold metal-dependent hydrolase
MTRPSRIVDAHVHLWDPARTDWYPYLASGASLGMGDVTGMARKFDVETYRDESPRWNVDKFVNVAAATGRHSADETIELDRRAETTGHPDAIIGGLVPTETVAEAVAMLDAQMAANRFRGVRPMSPKAPPVPDDDVLRALAERDLVFELMARPDQLIEAAERLSSVGDLSVVVEHMGWPRSAQPEEHELWKAGITALAGSGDRIHCKLSGLAMPLGEIGVEAFRPWVEHAIDAFGVDRCLFASNFPVDGVHGTLDHLWQTYAELTEGLSEDDKHKLFAANAERTYRI